MKRLFKVGNEYFGDKPSAKIYRDEHGGCVSKGPDHIDYGVKIKTHYGSCGHKQGQSIGDGFKKRRK